MKFGGTVWPITFEDGADAGEEELGISDVVVEVVAEFGDGKGGEARDGKCTGYVEGVDVETEGEIWFSVLRLLLVIVEIEMERWDAWFWRHDELWIVI